MTDQRPTLIRLNELFYSIQGEGIHAGRTAVFLRLQGCPVGCPWCDSKTTWYNGGEAVSLYELALRINAVPASDIFVVTGGEPLIHDLDPLFAHLRALWPDRLITLETSGAYAFKGQLRPDFVTLSPKAAARWHVDATVIDALKHRGGEIKLVVDRDITLGIVGDWLAEADASRVPLVLMPEGSPPSAESINRTMIFLRRFKDARFGPRLQYAYDAIGKLEGKNNEIISPMEARSRARELRTGSREVVGAGGIVHPATYAYRLEGDTGRVIATAPDGTETVIADGAIDAAGIAGDRSAPSSAEAASVGDLSKVERIVGEWVAEPDDAPARAESATTGDDAPAAELAPVAGLFALFDRPLVGRLYGDKKEDPSDG